MRATAATLPSPSQVCLLENTRFHPGDVANDPEVARQLAALCDLFVLDGFGVSHREQARGLPISAAFVQLAREARK